MPVRRLSRPDLRMLIRMGDIDAGVQLIQRARITSLKALLANVCEFEGPVTPDLFDVCCDAFDKHNEKEAG